MANRVALGHKGGGNYGLWVSKPGFDVLTAGESGLLFSSDWWTLQIVQTGRVSVPKNGATTVTIPDQGYRPAVIIVPEVAWVIDFPWGAGNPNAFSYATFSSNTSMTLHFDAASFVSYSGYVVYAVLRRDAHN